MRPYDQDVPEKPDGWDEAYREAIFIRANRMASQLSGRHEYIPRERGFFQMLPPTKWPVLDPKENMRAALAYFYERQKRGIAHVGVTSDAPYDWEQPGRAFLAWRERSELPGVGESVIMEMKVRTRPATDALRQLEAYARLYAASPASSYAAAVGTFSAPRVDLTVPGSPYMLRRVCEILDDLGRDAEEVFPREGTAARMLQRMRETVEMIGRASSTFRWGDTGGMHVEHVGPGGRVIPRVPGNYYGSIAGETASHILQDEDKGWGRSIRLPESPEPKRKEAR